MQEDDKEIVGHEIRVIESHAEQTSSELPESASQVESTLQNLKTLRSQERSLLIQAITTAEKVEIMGAREIGSRGLRLILDVDGVELIIETGEVEVIEGNLSTAVSYVTSTRARLNRVKRPEALSIQELIDRNLPLYWNEEWLRSELDRLGTYAEIAREHGYPSPVTIASYAKRKFGIDVQGMYAEKRADVYEDFDTGDYTQLELAQRNGVAVATVYRWLKEREEGKDTQARRGTPTTRTTKTTS